METTHFTLHLKTSVFDSMYVQWDWATFGGEVAYISWRPLTLNRGVSVIGARADQSRSSRSEPPVPVLLLCPTCFTSSARFLVPLLKIHQFMGKDESTLVIVQFWWQLLQHDKCYPCVYSTALIHGHWRGTNNLIQLYLLSIPCDNKVINLA